MQKLPHELYGLNEAQAAKVLKYIAVSYSSGKTIGETVLNYEGNEAEKLFCGFYVGYIVGMHTQYFVPETVQIIYAAVQTKYGKLIEKLAKDIAKDFGAPWEDIQEGIVKLIESKGGKPNGNNIWHHVVFGIFMGVDHQATRKQRIENVLSFLALLVDMDEEDIAYHLKRRKAEMEEDKLRDAF